MLGLALGKYTPASAAAISRLSLTFGRAGRYMLGQAGAPFDDTFEDNKLTHDARRFARYRAQVRAIRTSPPAALPGAGSTSR